MSSDLPSHLKYLPSALRQQIFFGIMSFSVLFLSSIILFGLFTTSNCSAKLSRSVVGTILLNSIDRIDQHSRWLHGNHKIFVLRGGKKDKGKKNAKEHVEVAEANEEDSQTSDNNDEDDVEWVEMKAVGPNVVAEVPPADVKINGQDLQPKIIIEATNYPEDVYDILDREREHAYKFCNLPVPPLNLPKKKTSVIDTLLLLVFPELEPSPPSSSIYEEDATEAEILLATNVVGEEIPLLTEDHEPTKIPHGKLNDTDILL